MGLEMPARAVGLARRTSARLGTGILRAPLGVVALVAMSAMVSAAPVRAQVINGTLMEVDSDRPISLGLVIMMTVEGDSVTSAVTGSDGRFSVEAEEAGQFLLVASAFGFKETRAGVFELGADGSMDVEFRVGAAAMPIDGILVELQRPSIEHQLVRNGFVRRLQRGLGAFVTPYEIERSNAMSAADLFRGIQGVSVRIRGGGLGSHRGETVQFLSANGYCTPTIYMDGLRLSPQLVASISLDEMIPLNLVDALEVYRRPAEIPIEYSSIGNRVEGETGTCGVVVIWTKHR